MREAPNAFVQPALTSAPIPAGRNASGSIAVIAVPMIEPGSDLQARFLIAEADILLAELGRVLVELATILAPASPWRRPVAKRGEPGVPFPFAARTRHVSDLPNIRLPIPSGPHPEMSSA